MNILDKFVFRAKSGSQEDNQETNIGENRLNINLVIGERKKEISREKLSKLLLNEEIWNSIQEEKENTIDIAYINQELSFKLIDTYINTEKIDINIENLLEGSMLGKLFEIFKTEAHNFIIHHKMSQHPFGDSSWTIQRESVADLINEEKIIEGK